MYGVRPTLDMFDGEEPVRLSILLETMRGKCDTLGHSETAAVGVLACFSGGDGRDVLQALRIERV